MRIAKAVLTFGLLLALPIGALAQEPIAAPPVMRITVEDIKPGSMGAHEKSVVSYQAFFSRAQVPQPRIGMVPVAGDQNQVLYLEGFQSFEALEAADKKLQATVSGSPALQAEMDALERNGGPLHASQRTMIAVFRPDLSYRPLSTSAVGKSRYVRVMTTQLKPGRTQDYEGYVKQLNRAREKANADMSTTVFEVTNGAPLGTFMTFGANRSMAEIDAARSGMAARDKAINEALGGEEVVRQRREMIETIVMETRTALYELNPKLGTPTAQIASADPDFWTPKAPGKALAVKKEEPKKK